MSASLPLAPPQSQSKGCGTLLHDSDRSYCHDGPTFEGFKAAAECQAACVLNPACEFVSYWDSGWCRLTTSCVDVVAADNGPIRVYSCGPVEQGSPEPTLPRPAILLLCQHHLLLHRHLLRQLYLQPRR